MRFISASVGSGSAASRARSAGSRGDNVIVTSLDQAGWWVTRTPSGDALVRAVAAILDDLAVQMRAADYAGG
jgi:hypothetical protein